MSNQIARTILLLSCTLLIGGCAQRHADWFFVDNSTVAEAETHRALQTKIAKDQPLNVADEFVVTGHRLAAGKGFVIAYRDYSPGGFLRTDQASFQKLTIFIPNPLPSDGGQIQVGRGSGAIAFFSRSSSNFPGKTGCLGYASDGSIRIGGPSEKEIVLDITIPFDLVSPAGWKEECGRFLFEKSVVLARKEFDDLTPWEGAIGTTVYDESIRPSGSSGSMGSE